MNANVVTYSDLYKLEGDRVRTISGLTHFAFCTVNDLVNLVLVLALWRPVSDTDDQDGLLQALLPRWTEN